MERNGSSISAIPSTGALDNESLLFIWEGDAGFPLPTQFRNKRSDCGSGSVRLIARPQLRREVVPSQHTRGWPPEKPLPSFLGVCPRAVAGPGARAGARPCLLARFPRFRCARTTPETHGPTSAVPQWGHPRETARDEQVGTGTRFIPSWCSRGAGVWSCCSPRAVSSTVTTASSNKCNNMPCFEKEERSFVTHRSPNLKSKAKTSQNSLKCWCPLLPEATFHCSPWGHEGGREGVGQRKDTK